MGLQSFSEKSVRRIRRQFPELDIEAIRVSHGGVWLYVRTSDDDHYLLNRKTGEVQRDEVEGILGNQVVHWTSCKERFNET